MIPVEARLAGSQTSCLCGRSVAVPNLSQLRRAAGETAIPRNVVERIRLAIREGELPGNRFCPFTGRPVNDTIWLHVQCERVMVRHRGGGWWSRLFFHLFFGWYALLFDREKGRDEFGHDFAVEVPLAISSSARESLAAARGHKALVDALRGTPLYRELLEEYPAAELWIVDEGVIRSRHRRRMPSRRTARRNRHRERPPARRGNRSPAAPETVAAPQAPGVSLTRPADHAVSSLFPPVVSLPSRDCHRILTIQGTCSGRRKSTGLHHNQFLGSDHPWFGP